MRWAEDGTVITVTTKVDTSMRAVTVDMMLVCVIAQVPLVVLVLVPVTATTVRDDTRSNGGSGSSKRTSVGRLNKSACGGHAQCR